MQARILEADPEGYREAGARLQRGEIVIFPTETVYGIGASIHCPDAIERIFREKGRPQDNPLIVHIAQKSALAESADAIAPYVRLLADQLWPGPLSLIVRAEDRVPSVVRAGLPTAAFRMPAHAGARAIIEACGCPVAAPSANVSGRPSPTCWEDVLEDFGDRDVSIVRGEPTEIGIESTVILATGYPPRILRPGAVTAEDIGRIVGCCEVEGERLPGEVPLSPGQKYGHYSASTPTLLLDMPPVRGEDWLRRAQERRVRFAAIVCDEYAMRGENIFPIGSYDDPAEAARRYFTALRAADRMGMERIYVQSFSRRGIGEGLWNRMCKSAAGNLIKEEAHEDRIR